MIAAATECAEAHERPELRGLDAQDVALLVASRGSGRLVHACFTELGRFLRSGDLLVVNTSGTLPAALQADVEGQAAELHLSSPVEGDDWVVELRTLQRTPLRPPAMGKRIGLPGGASAELLAPYLGSTRLSVARLSLGEPVEGYLRRHGHPIRYRHTEADLPIDAYQTVFARDPGSAEMPSAARPFTADLVTDLVAHGVLVAPITLHCGVSSLETGERPYPERYRVLPETAQLVNNVRWQGGRVMAVGTTVVRALETVADADGVLTGGRGLTQLVVTPERGMRAVDGLITGWHEPDASHLLMLEAVGGRDLIERSYDAALTAGYRWHEFGDSHLILR